MVIVLICPLNSAFDALSLSRSVCPAMFHKFHYLMDANKQLHTHRQLLSDVDTDMHPTSLGNIVSDSKLKVMR